MQQRPTREVLEENIFDGPRSIRDRDGHNPQLGSLRNTNREVLSFNHNPYQNWPQGRGTDKSRPKPFVPTGSFKSLADSGRLGPRDGSDSLRGRAGDHVVQKKMYLPGYTGYVRGMQHIAGRTYGEATRRALDTDYRENVCTSPIPSSPQKNLKVKHTEPKASFVSRQFSGKVYQVPGYTGFVPGARHTYARTYGSTTSQMMYQHSLKHPREQAREREGHAYTMRPREMLSIDSAPLPGGIKTLEPPGKLIPAHLRYLKFFAM